MTWTQLGGIFELIRWTRWCSPQDTKNGDVQNQEESITSGLRPRRYMKPKRLAKYAWSSEWGCLMKRLETDELIASELTD